MIIPSKHDGWVKHVRRVYDGGGSSSAPSTTTQTTDLPDWAKPYAQESLEKAKSLAAQPYQRYDQPRFAGFSPLQLQAQERAAGMTTAPQLDTATGIAQAASMAGLGAQYQPGYFGNQFRAPQQYQPSRFDMMSAQAPELQQYQMGPAERVAGGQYEAPMMDTARTNYRPDIQAFEMGPAERVAAGQYAAPEMTAAQTGYRPDLQQFQMGPAQQVGTQDYTGGNVAKYMDPYMQQVVGVQQREAQRQSDIAGTQEAGQAVKMGAFGGSRAGLLEAERQRNLATQLGNIQATGSQAAFQNAQQQFNQQQQREMAAQQANQAAGLTVGGQNLAAQLGVQQLGTQTGLQTALANLNNQQQAAVQNQAAQLQAQGLSAGQAMQAALANQQAGLTVGQQNLASRQAAQQLGTQTGLQTALANLTSEQQANVQNQAAQLQTQGLTAGQAMQAALANQQAGLTVGQQNLAAQLGTQQFGAGQNLQAQLANQQAYQNMLAQREASRQFGYGQQMTAAQQRAQYGQAAQQLAEQSRQYGAGYGLQGLQTALSGAGQLGNLGQTQYGQLMGINQLQQQTGAQQQALRQQGLSQAYQDFLNEQNYPYKQLGFMSDMIRGLPLGQQSTQQMYAAPSSMMGQLGGIGMGLYGMSRMGGFAEGGEVEGYADGGSVDSPENVASIVDGLSDQQLAQAKQAAQARGDFTQLQAIMAEESMRASERRGMAGAFNNLSQDTQQRMMAGGGIVAFADGDLVGDPMGSGASEITEVAGPPGRSFMEWLTNEPAWKAEARRARENKAAPADRSFDKAEEKRLSQDRAPTTTAKTPKTPKMDASISNAVTQMAKDSGVPEESLRSIYESYEKSLSDKSAAEMKSLMAIAEKSMGGSKEVKEQALGKALAEFGFKWAAAAAQPGAKFLGSAAMAAPTIAASQAESAKLAREMDQNDMKLRMNLKQFEIAQRKGDLATAASLAAQERQLMQQGKQLELQRSQLAETARHHKAVEGLTGQRYAATSARAGENMMRVKAQLAAKASAEAAKDWGDPYKSIEIKKQYPSQKAYQKSLFDQMWSQSIPLEHVGVKDPDEE